MQWFTLRPTFDIHLTESRQDAVDKIDRAYKRAVDKQHFLLFGEYGELHVPASEHRVWSPQLSFSINPRGERSVIHGRFAPRLEVWTFVWICYLTFAFSAFFGFILGFSQFMIGAHAWGTWIGVFAMLLWGSLLAIAHVGQQLSADQMRTLQGQLADFLRTAELHRQKL
jgi:hypothetical protein